MPDRRLRISGLCFLLGSFSLLWLGCREEGSKSIEREPITFQKEGVLKILRAETDSTLVVFDIEIADTPYEIQTGMMYREDMEQQQGMLFVFEEIGPRSFYMKNTLVALDILFIDENSKIIRIQRNAKPLNEGSIPSGGPVKYVLEIKAGMSDRWALQEGDLIQYENTP